MVAEMQQWVFNILKDEVSVDSIIVGLKEKLGDDKLKELLTDLIRGESVYLTVGGNYLNREEKATRKKKEAEEVKEATRHIFEKKPEQDFNKEWLQLTFIENKRFQSIINQIDKKFEKFFKKLCSLSLHGKEIRKNKQELLYVFYNIIYQRIFHDDYLMEGTNFINDAKTKIEKGDDSFVQRGILNAGLEHFTLIIDEVFEIPSLVLTAFESTTMNYKKDLKKYGELDVSDPNEQKLFNAVWKNNQDCNKQNIKFSPYFIFKKVNDKKKFISSNSIKLQKFTLTPLYNRYKQFRKRQQKKNKNSIRLPK